MRSFLKIKPSRNGKVILSFTDIGISCPSSEFLTSQICLNAISKNKILTKCSGFTVYEPEHEILELITLFSSEASGKPAQRCRLTIPSKLVYKRFG